MLFNADRLCNWKRPSAGPVPVEGTTSPIFRYLVYAANRVFEGRLFGRSLWSAWQPVAEYLGGGVETELPKDLALARC